jgi:hypothetical protein
MRCINLKHFLSFLPHPKPLSFRRGAYLMIII